MHINLNEMPVDYKKYTFRKALFIISSFIFLVFVFIVSISVGAVNISFADVIRTLLFQSQSKRFDLIIWNIRLPQALTAVTAGAALSISGLIMQAILNNPLGSPFTLGISHAASFGAALSVILFKTGSIQSKGNIQILNHYLTTGSAFFFCILTAFIILIISKIKKMSSEVMVLAGVALGSLFTAATMFLQYFATDVQLAAMVFWTFGDTARASWKELLIMILVTLTALIFFFYNSWNYNAMQSGDDNAKSLGVNTELIRIISMLAATLVTSVVVAFLGIIGFIGLVCPHMVKRIIGDDHRYLVFASAIAGAVLLLSADTLARTVLLPHVLPVAVITSFLGAPVFIYLLIKGYRK
ncbi:MAG: iron ABC transporter permease [Spirochaetes bacterium]|nr:iron ABC transporter permease [Spirochaetota bacterium]